jgi:alkanesulfonate monooxygenase SsuD/methylene tetrahydromethanopterin reductase-like flavin-dependent oxidoreductase (luciferase family)
MTGAEDGWRRRARGDAKKWCCLLVRSVYMRIGLSAGSPSAERAIEQAQEAEQAGFSSLWYPGAVGGDPLVQMALAGRATTRIELGTAVLQTYPCHPTLQVSRIKSVAAAVGRPVTLGVGPSHRPAIERLGLSYDGVGRHTEDYVRALATLLDGELPLLLAALGPRLLRVAGELADGTILWMANAQAIDSHVVPRITKSAAAAGRPAPRIVAGIPVAVHDDVAEARAAGAEQFSIYGTLPNYQRILSHGGISSPAEAVIVGDEDAVGRQIDALFAAGATDLWAAPFPVGPDRSASRARTRGLLAQLANN